MKFLKSKIIVFFAIISLGLVTGCNHNHQAELVFKNGFIYTVDSIRTEAEAIAIEKGKILFVGTDAEISNFIGTATRVIDLEGRMVLPGFIDSHCHPISAVKQLYEVNLYNLETIEEFQNAIKNYYDKHPDAEVIKGRGWSNALFGKSGPDKKYLDQIINEIPVSLSSEDGHSKWVNSKTLELAKITNKTVNPNGGIIERYDNSNEPSGTLRENAADLISNIFPYYGIEELKNGLLAYQDMALAFGITTSHDAYLDIGIDEIPAYKNLEKDNQLKMRFRTSLYVDPQKDVSQVKSLIKERNGIEGDLFQTNSSKIFIDGVVEGSTACLFQPYKHLPDSKGNLLWDIDKLNRVCAELDKNNFQIHVHSIGDRATNVILDAFEYTEKTNGKRDSRNSITHLQLVTPEDILRFKQLGVIAVVQPYWFMKDSYYYDIQIPYLGQKRADEEYPMASFFNNGVKVASSSDYPVTIPCNPLIAIQTGITRSEKSTTDPNEILWQEERVTLEQMITSFTINGAYANFLEDETGSLEIGKSADLIVLDKNLFEIPTTEISTTKVVLTIFQGKEVFRN